MNKDLSKLFDLKKMEEDLQKASQGNQVDGVMVEGRNTDKMADEIQIAEDLDSEKSNEMNDNTKKALLNLGGELIKGAQPSGMRIPSSAYQYSSPKAEDIMAARRNAIMNKLRG